jgi:hypothetical protein
MYDLFKEIVAEEHGKDLLREAEKYYILSEYPSRLLRPRGIYQKCLKSLGQLLSHLGERLQVRYGVNNLRDVADPR